MHYQKFPVSDALKPWVECFYAWNGRVETTVQSPPSGFAAIVFNFGNLYEAFQSTPEPQPVPRDFVCGLFTSNYQLTLKGEIDSVGIVLHPNSIHNLFGTRMSMLVNSRMDLTLLLGSKAAELRQALTNTQEAKRILILQDFIESIIPRAKNNLTIIDDALQFINTEKGCVEVAEVAEKFHISKRYLEKQFLVKVGVSPKFYARIKRFTHLSKEVAYNKNPNWQDIVFKYGFHDQSHLVKEFLEFNQMNPTDYFTKHQELIRFVKR